MTRGNSLQEDLRLLINNPKYSDVEILCEDKKKLYSCRAILAARSEVFDGLFYNGMKESYEKQVSFPKIHSSVMEIILEYIYTESIKDESLTKDNIIETFYAADYFQLPTLQDFIIKTIKNTNYAAELLTKFVDFVDAMPLSEDNSLLSLLVDELAVNPLNIMGFDQLSIAAFRCFLSCTYGKEKPFATSEYDVFRYSAILAAKQVSNDAYKSLMERLPTLEQINNSIQVEHNFIPDKQKIAKELEPLIEFIDFRRIKGQILVDIIEPLEILPTEIIVNVYRHKTKSEISDLNNIRGISAYIWDESTCSSKLIIEDNDKIVRAPKGCGNKIVEAKMILGNTGIFEWDIIIEKNSYYSWTGICTDEDNIWALSTCGSYYRCGEIIPYCPLFGNGAKITAHLDMDKRTLAFTVNGTKYREIPMWDDFPSLPSKLRPSAGLCYPGQIRIQPHRI